LEAFQVHGCCGIWGVLACAFFHIDKGILYGAEDSAKYLGAQVVGVLAITAWALAWSLLFCGIASRINFLRLSEEDEILGGDLHYFGPIEYEGDISDLQQSFREMKKKWGKQIGPETKAIDNDIELANVYTGGSKIIEIPKVQNHDED